MYQTEHLLYSKQGNYSSTKVGNDKNFKKCRYQFYFDVSNPPKKSNDIQLQGKLMLQDYRNRIIVFKHFCWFFKYLSFWFPLPFLSNHV